MASSAQPVVVTNSEAIRRSVCTVTVYEAQDWVSKSLSGGKWVGNRVWTGAKWVSQKTWQGMKWTGKKTYKTGRKVVSRTKKIIY